MTSILIFLVSLLANYIIHSETQHVSWVLTEELGDSRLEPQIPISFSEKKLNDTNAVNIKVDTTITYQSILGIGSSLESSSCYNFMQLDENARHDILKKLFDTEEGIGMNLMRVTIGTSDFCPPPYYSYDDTSPGDADYLLENFSTAKDEQFVVPVIQEAIAIVKEAAATKNVDDLLFFASPWSGPNFLKNHDSLIGGRLRDDAVSMETYARYLVKFIETYRDQFNINITALTVQNEPMANQSYPSTFMPPEQQAKLIGEYLGPILPEDVNIWAFDHNWIDLSYPRTVLSDDQAYQYVQGVAFHGYEGTAEQMTTLKEEFPGKDIYFSEGSYFKVRGAAKIVQILRNWSRSYNAWVTMLDSNLEPNSGPFIAHPTMVTLELNDDESQSVKGVKYNLEYYIYGQFSKYVRRNSVRISSETGSNECGEEDSLDLDFEFQKMKEHNACQLRHVAFMYNKEIIFILVNTNNHNVSVVEIEFNEKYLSVKIPPLSVSTFSWPVNVENNYEKN